MPPLFFKVNLFILRERESKRACTYMHMSEWDKGRERERERKKERIPSRLRTVSVEPDVGLELTNCEIMT